MFNVASARYTTWQTAGLSIDSLPGGMTDGRGSLATTG
jgi:hypothetical protein